jgi:hypothetical protein
MDCAHLLALPNPLAALWQRDAFHLAGQLGGKIIHADAHQVGALAQCPGVTGMVTQIFWDLEAANQGGLQAWYSGSDRLLGCGDCNAGCTTRGECGNNRSVRKSCECEENQ